MKNIVIAALALAAFGPVLAKLPPPDDAAKAKAAETAAKNAWQAKVDAYQLCKAQDRVAAQYRSSAAKSAPAKDAKAMPAGAQNTPAAAPPAMPVAGTVAAAAAQPAAAGTTPVAAAAPPPCADPGAFTYAAPAQKPLEASGAHSPTATAASPPSVKEPSAAMEPAKK